MEFGRIVVLRKGSTGATYDLDQGEHSIGSSVDCHLRLRLENQHILPKHAFVSVSSNGVAIITNKSTHAPVMVNAKPCLKSEVLKHGDIFEIVGKQFQYFNENLNDQLQNSQLFVRAKKHLLKTSRKSMPLVRTYTTCKTRSKNFSDKARARRSFMSAKRPPVKSRRNSLPAKSLDADDRRMSSGTVEKDQTSSPIQDNTVHSSASWHTELTLLRTGSDSPQECDISTTISDSDHEREEMLINETNMSDVFLSPRRPESELAGFPTMSPPQKISTRTKTITIDDEEDTSLINITSSSTNLSDNTKNLTFEFSSSCEMSDLALSPALKGDATSKKGSLKDSTDPLKIKSTTSVNIFGDTTQEANQRHFGSMTNAQTAPDSRNTTFDKTTLKAFQPEKTGVPSLNSTTKISGMSDVTVKDLSPVKPLKPNKTDLTNVRRSLRNSVLAKTALTTSLKESTAMPFRLENYCDDSLSSNTNATLEIDVVNFTPMSEAKSGLKVLSDYPKMLDDNESPLKHNSGREPIFTSTPFVKTRIPERSVTTELSKPVKRRSLRRLSISKGDRPSQPKRARSLSLPQLPKVENKKLLSRSVFQPTDPKDVSLKRQLISKRKPNDPCETTLEMLDVVKDETPKSHIKPVRRLSKANASTYNPVVEDITPVTPGVLQESDFMGDLFKTPTNTPGLFESIRESAMRSRKRGRESHVVLFPEKNDSTRTIDETQTSPQLQQTSSKPALRKRQEKSPLNRLSNFEGIKRLMRTPAKSPRNDLTKVPNLRKLMSPQVQRSPKNDLINVPNLRKLMSPRVRRSPKNDLTNIPNLRKIMSPRPRSSRGIGSLIDTSGVDLLHNDSDDDYSKDLFTRISGKFPIKAYKSKGKSLSPDKGERTKQNENSRKSMGGTPSCSPRVSQWVHEQVEFNAKHSSFVGDSVSAKSLSTRGASSKKRQDNSRQKTSGDKVKGNFTQPESVEPDTSSLLLSDSYDIGRTDNQAAVVSLENPKSEDVFDGDNEINIDTKTFKRARDKVEALRQTRTPLKALVTENVIKSPQNTVSKVLTRRSSKKLSPDDSVPQNDTSKATPSKKRLNTAEAIDIAEPPQTGDPLQAQVAQKLSLVEGSSSAFSLRRTTRKRKILSDDDLNMVMESPNPVLEHPNAAETTERNVWSLSKTTKKFTRSQLARELLPAVEAKFNEKSEPIHKATKTAKLKTRSNSRKKDHAASLQTADNDLDTEKITKTELNSSETSAGRPIRTTRAARKLRQEPKNEINTILPSDDDNSQITAGEKNKMCATKEAQENLGEPDHLKTTSNKSTRGKNKVVDEEEQSAEINGVSENVPSKLAENSSPEIVKTRARRANKLPSVSTNVENRNVVASGSKNDTPQKMDTSKEKPTRTRGRKLENAKAQEPKATTHEDVDETKKATSPVKAKGKKRAIGRSASPVENDNKRETRRRRKIETSVEPERATSTTQTPIKERTKEKKSSRKQTAEIQGRQKHVQFDISEAQVKEPRKKTSAKKKTASNVLKCSDAVVEADFKDAEAAQKKIRSDSDLPKPRVSVVAQRTRSRAKKV